MAMPGTDDVELTVNTEDGPVRMAITRQALSRLSGRSHVTPEEIASAYRVEIEDIVRTKTRSGEPQSLVRLTEADFQAKRCGLPRTGSLVG
jgi:hypothetical protein